MPSLVELQVQYPHFKTVFHRKCKLIERSWIKCLHWFYISGIFLGQKGNVGVGFVGETMLYLKRVSFNSK